MPKILRLTNLQTVDFKSWVNSAQRTQVHRLLIVSCGYEARARHWAEQCMKAPWAPQAKWMVLAIEDFPDALSRKNNESFYAACKLPLERNLLRDSGAVCEKIKGRILDAIKAAGQERVEIHIDYSCMPRQWYCNFPAELESVVRPDDKIYFWYSLGDYHKHDEYPTAGFSDFEPFAGAPSLSARSRTHLLGLGLDKIRSHSICSVVDPQNLVCFYPIRIGDQDYTKRIRDDHRDIFRQASFECALPMDDFAHSLSQLCSLAREFRAVGDVILLPDGPKPLILASALVPLRINQPGICSYFVSRMKPRDYKPVDVTATGYIMGFQFDGPRPS